MFHKGRELYGLYQARMANRQLRAVLVVEGYMDVIAPPSLISTMQWHY